MKVKISYTTDYDKVPEECWRLLDSKIHSGFMFTESLEDLFTQLNANADDFSALYALQKIHKIRTVLADYDETLNDITSIIEGWSKLKLQPASDNVILNTEQQSIDSEKLMNTLKVLKEVTEVQKSSIE